MRSAITASIILASTCMAWAESPPNLVGTWSPTGEITRSRLGGPSGGWAGSKTAVLDDKATVTVTVERQNGRSISGYVTLPNGSKDPFVGVLKQNGRQVLMSDKVGLGTMDLTDDGAEVCWTDTMPEVVAASCENVSKKP